MRILNFVLTTVFLNFNIHSVQTLNSENFQKQNKPEIVFEKLEYDFGSIPIHGDGNCEFVFTNISKEPVVINDVKASCGCTVPSWANEPVGKGEKGVIYIEYDTHKAGRFYKSVTVYSNAKNNIVRLIIKGKVERKKRSN